MSGGRRSRRSSSVVTPDAPSPPRPRWQGCRAPHAKLRPLNIVSGRERHLYMYRFQPQMLHHPKGKAESTIWMCPRERRATPPLTAGHCRPGRGCALQFQHVNFANEVVLFCDFSEVSHHPCWIDNELF